MWSPISNFVGARFEIGDHGYSAMYGCQRAADGWGTLSYLVEMQKAAAPLSDNVIKLEALYMEQPKMKRVHPFRDALVLRKGHGKEAD